MLRLMSVTSLDSHFADGTLVRPSDSSPNIVHLVRSLATLCGVQGYSDAQPVRDLVDTINVTGPSQHLIFILLDGLGMNLIRQLPADSFLASHLRRQINATCPSTTAVALTTVATAEYPNRHAVTGWFTHLPERELTATVLPFAERFSGQPLAARGIAPADVLPMPPVYPRMTARRPVTLTPNYIANTVYNTWSRGPGTTGLGYESLTDAIDKLIDLLQTASGPTYAHLYLHDVDTLCHHVGTQHESVVPLVLGIDAELTRLHETVGDAARIVVSADHGLIDVPKDQQTLLQQGDPLLELLVVPPSGDARMPIFNVRAGQHDRFAEMFRQRMDGRIVLLRTDEAEAMELFGPGELSPIARRRFGDFLGIPIRPATLGYHPPHKPLGELYLAVHAGLSPQEMIVPVCVA
jgi:hypothetical protein